MHHAERLRKIADGFESFWPTSTRETDWGRQLRAAADEMERMERLLDEYQHTVAEMQRRELTHAQ